MPACASRGIAAIDDVDATALTFATDERFLRAALASRAAAVLADATLVDPARAYAEADRRGGVAARSRSRRCLALLEPPRPRGPFVASERRRRSGCATIGADVYVGPLAVVGARRDDRCRNGARRRRRDRRATRASAPAARCIRAPTSPTAACSATGSCCRRRRSIGSDGFGWAFLEGALQKIPQIGIVVLGDDVEIGANTCIDRAQTGVTSIGNGTKIDNLCQIGHNCRIGRHTAIAALTGLAGTTIDRRLRAGRRPSRVRGTPDGRLAGEDRRRRGGLGRRARRARPSAARRRATTARTCGYRRPSGAFRNSTNVSKRSNVRARTRRPIRRA